MPEKSSIKKFVEAVKTGKTKTTKVLNAVFENKTAAYNGSTLFDASHLGQARFLDDLRAPDLDLVRDELRKPGKSDPELALDDADLDHMNSWSPDEKEKVRKALVDAVGASGAASRNIHFSWALYDGGDSKTDVDDPGPPGDIVVRFLSPRKNVDKSGFTYGEINVKI